jgi:hypothetical protein
MVVRQALAWSVHIVEYEEPHHRYMEDYKVYQLERLIYTSEHHRANL